ncbi:MAG: alcohol dehydrogenase catalytic domain-containing protein [Proteobacteria bacterium]|nr:alcohol dehydrogenase catalytic domain-containing protein [Pseudomonadota bacterium]
MQTIRVSTFDGPGTRPQIRTVPRPDVPNRAALIRIEACGVCGTDLHILRGHWPKPLPWPLTLGHELAGVLEEIGPGLTTDFMNLPLAVGDKVMLPPLMPCAWKPTAVTLPFRCASSSDPVAPTAMFDGRSVAPEICMPAPFS